MTAPIPLTITRLTKRYRLPSGGDIEAVSDVSFEVGAGECFGLLGPNGAGKTTVINCLSGLYPVTSGEVTLGGIDVHRDPKAARRLLGVCAQEDTLDSDFRVFDQLVRYATFFRIQVEEGRRRARALLERFGLNGRADDPVESLSGGMKRRLQVARALISAPKLLVLDEPTTGLDPEMRRVLWDILMEERAAGTAILLCTHYMDEAERLCDRVAIIARGRILDVDAPSRMIARHMGTQEVVDELRPGVVWRRAPNLEDVYLKLTGTHLRWERQEA
ncbi:MAG: ABC transporter ATP-binding protein [Betaproteobacteria bacterium]|nr:ABC transporter ATP-binding protein [Betaproteobacteria bacterium]